MYGYHGYDYDTPSDPSVRAADADREATAERLRQHHADGRIDVNEFQERLDRTYQAKTIGELRQLVSDLPREQDPRRFGRGVGPRPLWMFPWIPILVVLIAISALHHAGLWGLWVLIPLFFVARFLLWGHRPWRRRRYQTPQV